MASIPHSIDLCNNCNTISGMSAPFTQLFLLPDELVRVKVMGHLSLKELSRLDIAFNNKCARNHFLC